MKDKTLREWTIIDGIFQRMDVHPKSILCFDILEALRPLHLDNAFVRGSILEECIPHPKSDIDILVFSDPRDNGNLCQTIRKTLHFTNRTIEVISMPRDLFFKDIPRALLGTTRSFPIVGPVFPTLYIPADIQTARAHWNLYNPLKYQAGYSQRKLLIVAKQLFRAVGVIQLIENQRFSRHLPTCLQWAWEIAPVQVAQCYQHLWVYLNRQPWQYLDLQPVYQWLEQKENQYELRIS